MCQFRILIAMCRDIVINLIHPQPVDNDIRRRIVTVCDHNGQQPPQGHLFPDIIPGNHSGPTNHIILSDREFFIQRQSSILDFLHSRCHNEHLDHTGWRHLPRLIKERLLLPVRAQKINREPIGIRSQYARHLLLQGCFIRSLRRTFYADSCRMD